MGVTVATATHAAKAGRSSRAARAAAFLARPTSLLLQKTCDCGAAAGLSGHCATCDRASLSSRPGPGTAADVASFAPGISPDLAPDLGRLGVSSTASQSAVKPSPVAVPKPPSLGPATIVPLRPRVSGSGHDGGEGPARSSFDIAPRATAAPAPAARRPPEPAPARPAPPASVVRHTSPVRVQTEMRVSSPADQAEREAQSVGKMIARMPDPDDKSPAVHASAADTAQREAAPVISDRSAEPPTAHRFEASGQVDPHVLAELRASSSGGSPLPAEMLSFMEPRFRADFSSVRIHTDAHAARLSAQLGARAFTIGKDIYFARGQFRPDSPDGWELIAHELTHTIQQGGVRRPPPSVPSGAAAPSPKTEPARPAPPPAAARPAAGGVAALTRPLPPAPVPMPVAGAVSAPIRGPMLPAAGAERAGVSAAVPGAAGPTDKPGQPTSPVSTREATTGTTSAPTAPSRMPTPAAAAPAAPAPVRAAPPPPAAAPVAQPQPGRAPAPAAAATGGEATLAAVVAHAAGLGPGAAHARPAPAPAHVAAPVHHLPTAHAPAPSRAPVPAHAAERGKKPPAPRAAAPVRAGRPYAIAERAPVSLQRLGISDALEFFADKANLIPGFRMLTIILGVNPINMSPVDRSAANILRALIEFIPGGGLIVQALDNSGVFDKVGAWVAEQIETLTTTGAALKQAVMDFLGSLSFSDIFDLGGVWERAKRIFTEPIDRLINFAKGAVTAILKFIKDAILLPLAKLAEGTRGWDLLIGVLGRNPITGDAVPRTPELLIGGFLKLIGQDEIWQNMQKSNAIQRAWAWFQGALNTVVAFVSQIPDLFTAAFKSLTVEDVVLVSGAFQKVGSVFGDFLGKFTDWAGKAIWNLLEIIFDVVSPGAFEYVKKTGDALHDILKNPLPFVLNLVKAAKLGLQNFADNIGMHLKTGLIEWLTGAIPGVYIPQAFSLVEIGKFALSVLGITWGQIRAKIVKALGPTGETIMKGLETAFDVIKALVTGGPAAAWELIKEKLSDLKDTVIDGLISFVTDTIVQKAIPKLVALFVPGAGFISAIISIYGTIKSFMAELARIAAAIKAFVDSIVAIAKGQIDGAANMVENALASVIPIAIGLLAGFLNLGDIPDKIKAVIEKVRAAVDKALDAAIAWIVTKAKALFAKLFGKSDDKKAGGAGGDVEQVTFAGEHHQLQPGSNPDQPTLELSSSTRRDLSAAMTILSDKLVGPDGIVPKESQPEVQTQIAEVRSAYDTFRKTPPHTAEETAAEGAVKTQLQILGDQVRGFIKGGQGIEIGDWVYVKGQDLALHVAELGAVNDLFAEGRILFGVKAAPFGDPNAIQFLPYVDRPSKWEKEGSGRPKWKGFSPGGYTGTYTSLNLDHVVDTPSSRRGDPPGLKPPYVERGHVVAHSLGGSDGLENLVAQTPASNDAMAGPEGNARNDIKKSGSVIDYSVTLDYAGRNPNLDPPAALNVRAERVWPGATKGQSVANASVPNT